MFETIDEDARRRVFHYCRLDAEEDAVAIGSEYEESW